MPRHGRGDFKPQASYTSAQISSVKLPEKISCASCKKNKGQNQYSNKQLNDLKFKIWNSKTAVPLGNSIRCRLCTGVQPTEMTCSVCGFVKSLTDFSLAQRKTPDTARCLECIEEALEVEPDNRKYTTGNEENEDILYSDSDSSGSEDVWEIDSDGNYATSETDGGVTLGSDSTSSTVTSRSTGTSNSLVEPRVKLTTDNLAALNMSGGKSGFGGGSIGPTFTNNELLLAQSRNPTIAGFPKPSGPQSSALQSGSYAAAAGAGQGIGRMPGAYGASRNPYLKDQAPSAWDGTDTRSMISTTDSRATENKNSKFPRVRPVRSQNPRFSSRKAQGLDARVHRLESDVDSNDDDDDDDDDSDGENDGN